MLFLLHAVYLSSNLSERANLHTFFKLMGIVYCINQSKNSYDLADNIDFPHFRYLFLYVENNSRKKPE